MLLVFKNDLQTNVKDLFVVNGTPQLFRCVPYENVNSSSINVCMSFRTLKSNNLVNIQSKTFHGLKTLKSL